MDKYLVVLGETGAMRGTNAANKEPINMARHDKNNHAIGLIS
jgi:hypothetical protein